MLDLLQSAGVDLRLNDALQRLQRRISQMGAEGFDNHVLKTMTTNDDEECPSGWFKISDQQKASHT